MLDKTRSHSLSEILITIAQNKIYESSQVIPFRLQSTIISESYQLPLQDISHPEPLLTFLVLPLAPEPWSSSLPWPVPTSVLATEAFLSHDLRVFARQFPCLDGLPDLHRDGCFHSSTRTSPPQTPSTPAHLRHPLPTPSGSLTAADV